MDIQKIKSLAIRFAIAKREAKSHAISDRVAYLKLIKSYIALPEAEEAIAS